VSQQNCSHCGRAPKGKLCTLFPARIAEGNVRVSYRVKLCMGCAVELKETMQLAMAETESEYIEWPESCPSCHAGMKDQMDTLWVTAFLPKQPKRQLTIALCTDCAPSAWARLTEGGVQLDSDNNGTAGAEPLFEVPW
jgi:hypothetical protein